MFLATTAIESFWNKEQPMVFLGEWCKLYSRQDEYSKLDFIDVPFVWKDANTIENGIIYCDNIYNIFLAAITETLNNIHGLKKSSQYYHILLGNWLIQYIHQYYDKYLTLKSCLDKFPNLDTYLLDKSQYYIPINIRDYINKISSEDSYALQMFSELLSALGCQNTKKLLEAPLAQSLSYSLNHEKNKANIFYQLINHASLILNKLSKKNAITLTSPHLYYNNLANHLKLLKACSGMIVFNEMRYPIDMHFEINIPQRKQTNLALNQDEFTTILSQTLFQNLPVLFLEGFHQFRDYVLSLPIKKTKAYFSVNALHFHDIFKFHVAENKDDITILSMQHGAGYCTEKIHAMENYERSISDVYFTWGSCKNTETRWLPPSSLKCKPPKSKDESTIFLCMTDRRRYVVRLYFQYLSNAVLHSYIASTISFINHLDSHVHLFVRDYPIDISKWSIRQRIIGQLKHEFITWDDHKNNFFSALNACRLFVTDHNGTTFLEAMAMNKPTVIFLDPSIHRFRHNAQPIFDALKANKIFHDNPVSAANHVSEIYQDIDKWWKHDRVQAARNDFVNAYAKAHKNWERIWSQEFKKIL